MWIRVALDKNAVHYGNSPEYTYVDGEISKNFILAMRLQRHWKKMVFFQKCGPNWMQCLIGVTMSTFTLKDA